MPQHDVFPAHVIIAPPADSTVASELSTTATRGDQYRFVNTARVTILGNRVLIATDGAMGPVVVFEAEINPESLVKSKDGDSYFTTTRGFKVAYRKDSSCGCGSRLKSWSPFKHLTSVKDPS